MRWSVRLGSLFGVRIEVHVTFLLVVIYAAIAGGLLQGDVRRAVAYTLLILALFGCVLLHELGHAVTAARYGIRTRDIILLPIGGVARLQRMPERPGQEIVIALAGPAVNVAIVLVLLGVRWALPRVAGVRGDWVGQLAMLNVAMAAFNLIPAFPMDGGRVLRATLALRLSYPRATAIAANVGQAFALLFAAVGLFYNPVLVFVALFVFLAASEERAVVEARTTIAGLPVRAAMLTDFQALDVRDPLRRAMDLLMAGSQNDFPVVDRSGTIGVLTRDDLIRALREGGAEQPVGQVIRRDGEFAEAGEPLEDVVTRMRASGRSALPVMSRGELLGLITLENVGDLLLVRDALRRHHAER